jgi:hypothetical protein
MVTLRWSLALVVLSLVLPMGYPLSMDNGSSIIAAASEAQPVVPSIYVAFIASSAQPTALQESTYYCVLRHFAAEGIALSRDPQEHVVFVDAAEKGGIVALSFLFGVAIPDDVVQLCKNTKVFYNNLSAEKRAALSSEGKWIREMVTEEFIRQFISPMRSQVLMVEKGEMEKQIGGVVEEFCKVHWRQQKP